MVQSGREAFSTLHSSDFNATLRFSQQAPSILSQQHGSSANIFSIPTAENPEQHVAMEMLLLACLRAGDDKSAKLCLEQLSQRFGPSNEKIMGLRGLYKEATAEKMSDLEDCLREYDRILAEDPVNMPVRKRRVAILRSMSRPLDAISALVELLEAVPTDAEAWCELADLYQSQGMSSQAIFSIEEALLISPHSWNLHALAGELLYIGASSAEVDTSTCRLISRSIRLFSRSIELCENYLRGYYGLALATSFLLEKQSLLSISQNDSSFDTQSLPTLQKLNAFAIKKLHDLVKSRSSEYDEWEYSQSELIAAKGLLDRLKESAA
ncbi:hypothetical protein ASPZODRAFT_136897 [Penicilliopsis zonata CBS 506.65]|uniref:ER membrane protein complex subunit 2 n=1 Tax=Penicilliopsis zonata CBS 506.65 TaxID=1073090 RepID=A0A1L9S769_9EURO|nr:hypothetical protein ASPZODRAFT_136897 [Penicilliopsis zonata CBS 506.65]OJJ43015.1 hypothetical protein ASPZODRAFT_136897 [Penicilliopsis zonata CBS 506.65]